MDARYKIEIFQSRSLLRGREWYIRIRAGNGEKVLTGEGHKNKSDCEKLAHTLRGAMAAADIVFMEK